MWNAVIGTEHIAGIFHHLRQKLPNFFESQLAVFPIPGVKTTAQSNSESGVRINRNCFFLSFAPM